MATGQSCDDDERENCERESTAEGGERESERNDPKGISSKAFDSFLTAILNTPPDKLPPIPDEEE